MIARLRGELDEKQPGEVVVDVGGVGYCAAISANTFNKLPEPGAPVDLYTVTNLRENALELFAFADVVERTAFNVLRSVNGIGPRLALSILSGIESEELARVVADKDIARLVAVPGVGRKTAERILVELADKMPKPAAATRAGGALGDAVAALLALGYKRGEAMRAAAAARDDGAESVEDIIRRALAKLA